ncbi:lipopolysaccharide core heptose(I) kinase RfaP [Methylovorus sp. MM2]|uniref:lipopolysaccharide core heptose(I) kinase RfaP n=1 Tax=Methylovorus sp. MM2 TaxID=1848038 RepID=UPI0009EEFA8F|nr:lipopolysaccharide core heptose(I) kinase RfaP [Methylovorus sp. MM2]
MSVKKTAQREFIAPEIKTALPEGDTFSKLMAMDGEVFRDMPGRKTIKVDLAGQSYFIKQHFGVGWGEIFKNLTTFRLPIIGAGTEWQAIQTFDSIGIPTTQGVAYGERGFNPATQKSFVVTRDLGDITSLEDIGFEWKKNPPPESFKRKLILEVAKIARALHDNGMNHRDFYICHFCLDNPKLNHGEIYLYLIDLHRVGIRDTIKPKDRMKDIAALYFSAMDIGLNTRDYLRFLRAYRQKPLRDIFDDEKSFWHKVRARADKLYVKFHAKTPK